MPKDGPTLFPRTLAGEDDVGYIAPRLPPQNLQAEQALLGALLCNNKAYDRVARFLNPAHFANPVHGRIYEAIANCVTAGRIADPVTLVTEFQNAGILNDVGGTAYLAELTTAMVGIINAGITAGLCSTPGCAASLSTLVRP